VTLYLLTYLTSLQLYDTLGGFFEVMPPTALGRIGVANVWRRTFVVKVLIETKGQLAIRESTQ